MLAAVCLALLGASTAGAAQAYDGASPPPPGQRSVLVVFLGLPKAGFPAQPAGLSVGLLSATQGQYTSAQFLLDITQGARVASSAYHTPAPPPLSLIPAGSGARVAGWHAAYERARAAPQVLTPGLLASRIGGSAGYAGIEGQNDADGAVAADASGRIAAVSIGSAATLPARIAALRAHRRLVVADLPAGPSGTSQLQALGRERSSGELLIVLERVPDGRRGELLWAGVGGLRGGAGKELTSQTTEQHGLIASVDVAPTILTWLGDRSLPSEMRGKPIETDGRLDSSGLRNLMQRLRVLGGRRLKALAFLLSAWALLLLAASPWPRIRARAIRAGALGVLWAPVAVMVTGGLEPSAGVEYAAIALLCLGLGSLSDLLMPWPRAPIMPTLTALIAITVDALSHTQLLMRSLLGPNPILGARFYGVGNELKSALAVMVLSAVAGALHPSVRERRTVLLTVLAGVVLAAIEGSARIGAGVGGVILVSVSFAVAAIVLAPGALTRRRALALLLAPIAALVALALIDLATAHGGGHFTGSVLHARSPGDVRDIIVRRYKAAFSELHNHAMPEATVLSLLFTVAAVRLRERLLRPVGEDPLWLAAVLGSLAAGVAGALVEDSGPVLLVVAVFTLGCVLSYLWGRPQFTPRQRSPGRSRATRSRARKPSEAHAR